MNREQVFFAGVALFAALVYVADRAPAQPSPAPTSVALSQLPACNGAAAGTYTFVATITPSGTVLTCAALDPVYFVNSAGAITLQPSFLASSTQPAPTLWMETPSGTIDGANAIFSTSVVPYGEWIQVFKNGSLLDIKSDFTISGQTVTFSLAATPQPGDLLQVTYYKAGSGIQ